MLAPSLALFLLPVFGDGSSVVLVSPSGAISRSTTTAIVDDRSFVVQSAAPPVAIELSASSRTLWFVYDSSPGGPLVAGRVDLTSGQLHSPTGALPCARVSDIAAPLAGQRWFVAEPSGDDTLLWHGDLPHGDLALFTTLVGRPHVTGLSFDAHGRLIAYDAGHQVLLAIDTTTAAVSTVGPTGLTAAAPRGLDLDPASGKLFGVFEAPGAEARLGRVDPASGRVELVAPLPGAAAPFLAIERATTALGTSQVPWSIAATTHAYGSGSIERNDLVLVASGLPTHSFGLFLASAGHALPAGTQPGGLCLAPPFVRLAGGPGHLLPTGADGRMRRALDLAALPAGGAFGPLGSSTILHFQAWARAGSTGPTFATPISVPLTSHDPGPIDRYPAQYAPSPALVAHGDVDADGDNDVVYSVNNLTGFLGRNDGTGNFTSDPALYLGQYTSNLELIDVDADSDVDLIWTSYFGGICVARNSGTGVFAPNECSSGCRAMRGVRVADIDGDGWLDLCYACELLPQIVIVYGAAAGFDAPRTYATPSSPAAPAIFDVDQDGRLDLIVPMKNESSLVVLRNQSARTFVALPPVPTGANPAECDGIDLHSDAGPEVVTWSTTQRTLTIHSAAGGAALPIRTTTAIPQLSSRPKFVDLDRDGLLDLSVRGGFGLSTLRNDGQGNFALQWPLEITVGYAGDITVADFDGDGWLDAFGTGNEDNAVICVRGGPSGWPAPRTRVTFGPGAGSLLVVADLDGDAREDLLAIVANELHVARGLGGGQFAPPVVSPSMYQSKVPVVGDLDGDGDLDHAGIGSEGLIVQKNLGALQFGAPASYPTPYAMATLDLGDLDRDGDLDAVVVGTNTVSVRWNDGTGAFPTLRNHFVSAGLSAVTVVDLDADGWLDVLVASVVHQFTHVFYNDGQGNLLPAVSPVSGSTTARVASRRVPVADLDDDGLLDIVATNVFLNQGGRRPFREVATSPDWLFHEERVTLADLDGDGWSDAISTRNYLNVNEVRFRRGLGHGRFGATELYFAAGVRGDPIIGDLDGDARPEVVLGTTTTALVLSR